MAKIPFGSREYLHVPITLDDDSSGVSLSDVTVEIAVLSEGGDPALAGVDWHGSAVVGDAQAVTSRVLEPGTRPRGRYDVWARITAGDEKVLRKAGVLTVT